MKLRFLNFSRVALKLFKSDNLANPTVNKQNELRHKFKKFQKF